MKLDDVQKLPHGLYRVYWKGEGGGSSLAAVGSDRHGRRWLAPTNWITVESTPARNPWRMVEKVELIYSKGMK
jgi:hypothetical protein